MRVDDYSRVAYAEVLSDECKGSAVLFLRRAVRWFAQYGIQVKRVLTDNGPYYKAATWKQVCEKLRIKPCMTRLYRPQTNVYQASEERKRVLPDYLIHYNQHREHGSLDGLRPGLTDAWWIQPSWNL